VLLAPHPPLADTTRLPHFAGGRAAWREVVVLLAFGAAAAALTTYVRLGIRVPGRSILQAVVPLALALAVVPRRSAGSVAGIGALGGALLMGGTGLGVGALTSLSLTGPVLDLAVRRARTGRGVYLGLILGGLASNWIAFIARLVPKLLGEVGRRPLAEWWPHAIVSYSICGAAAGLVSAAPWFKFRGGGATK
jgi:hypothetical protein